jgi:hypothetical protein
MIKIFTQLKDLEIHLRRLKYERGDVKSKNGGRIDGKDSTKLSLQESDQARRTAEVFFEYNDVTYGLAGDTTFDSVDRFLARVEMVINGKAVFSEDKTRAKGKKDSDTRCLHVGNDGKGAKGWYCYQASYFINCPDQVSSKAA